MESEISGFEDGENYSSFRKEGMSFKDIVLLHTRKITQLSCVEFRGGYWNINEIPVSVREFTTYKTNKIYVPDSREEYSNAVEVFADLLFPHFDSQMKEAEEKLNAEMNKAYAEYNVISEEEQTAEEQAEEEMSSDKPTYRTVRRNICRKLFRELCSFLYRRKYLEIGQIED